MVVWAGALTILDSVTVALATAVSDMEWAMVDLVVLVMADSATVAGTLTIQVFTIHMEVFIIIMVVVAILVVVAFQTMADLINQLV
ncbi:MAG: hypothetical protein D4R91_04710 [Sediminibacterium sp.]|nr:MAG: hypothetical protein D4R91_04710 [Sediminibacterium sp.]